MFCFKKDILVPEIDLWLDSRRVRDFGYISHAHADHIARHRRIICSHPTADLLKYRIRNPQIQAVDYESPLSIGAYRITLYPAGHILGSSQILLEEKDKRLLYTGDFRLAPGRSVEGVKVVEADVLIMETTFGSDKYRFPPRKEMEEKLLHCCQRQLNQGRIPVVFAYNLGKGQEALKILSESGLPVAVDYQIDKYTKVYRKYGVEFGSYLRYRPSMEEKAVWLLPSGFRFRKKFTQNHGYYKIFLSGWGMDDRAGKRYAVDEVIPISDHADFDELLEAVKMMAPKEIYCTHGSKAFIHILREAGYKAFDLETMHQLELNLI